MSLLNPLRGILKKTIIAVILIVIFLWISLDKLVTEIFIDPAVEKMNNEVQKHWIRIEKDFEIVRNMEVFQVEYLGNDAASFLNTRIEWRSFEDKDEVLRPPIGKSEIKIPLEIRQKIESKDKNWIERDIEKDSLSVKTDWFDKLEEFQYWTLMSDMISLSEEEFNYVDSAFPDLIVFRTWARLVLIETKKKKNYIETSRRLRNLSRLLYSTNHLLAAAIAVAILKDEDNLKTYLMAQGEELPNGWTTYTKEQTNAAKRLFFAMSMGFNVQMKHEYLDEVFLYKRSPCYCLSLAEISMMSLMYKESLEERFKEQYKKLTSELDRNGKRCNLDFVEMLWQDNSKVKDVAAIMSDQTDNFLLKHLLWLPGIKEPAVLTVFTIGAPNGFRSYQDKAEEKKFDDSSTRD